MKHSSLFNRIKPALRVVVPPVDQLMKVVNMKMSHCNCTKWMITSLNAEAVAPLPRHVSSTEGVQRAGSRVECRAEFRPWGKGRDEGSVGF